MLTIHSDSATRFLNARWLEGVDAATRLLIWQVLQERSEPARVALVEESQPNQRLWFVEAGSVAVERSGPRGRPEILAELDGPAIYGTTTFFRDAPSTMTLRATSPVQGWTLERAAYDRLRVEQPEAAEALALAVVQVLSERFDMLDRRLTALMTRPSDNPPRATEWANFRSRLFEEPAA